jgi:Mannosyltransferase (PIG-V)
VVADLDIREQAPVRIDRKQAGLPDALSALIDRLRPRLPLLRGIARPLGLYLASRLVVYAAIGVVIMLHLGLSTRHFNSGFFPDHSTSRPLFEALGMWDGGWYLHIVTHGYDTQLHPVGAYLPSVAFLPLLPILVKATAFVTGLKALHAGILTVFMIGALASVCVWLFVRHLTDGPTADRATALWCFFPGAMTLSFLYAEGLLVILAVVCLYALMQRRWLVAGLAALLASATAPEGLALVGCCAWAAGAALLHRERTPDLDGAHAGERVVSRGPSTSVTVDRHPWLAPVAPVLAPLGFLAYQAYLWRRTGDITYWYWAERSFWNGGFNPWGSTVGLVQREFQIPLKPDYLIPTLTLLVLVAATILLWRWKPPAIVTIYGALVMAFVISSGTLGVRPRFFIAAFPFVVVLARSVRGAAFSALLGVSAGLLALLTLIIAADINPALAFTP